MQMKLGRRELGHVHLGGFTLVELLVVVSIICLLVSLLLPSLNRAHSQGEQIHCLANQHQLFLGWLLYAGDSDDRLCRPRSYRRTLEPYVYSEEVFVCRSVADGDGRESYAVSNTMGGESRDGVKPYSRLHTVCQPTDKLLFVDKEVRSQSCYWPILWHEEAWTWRPWSWPPGLQGMTSRHGNGCNMTFADGHGEGVHWTDERTLRLIRGTIADPVPASKNNPDLARMIRVLAAYRTAPSDPNEPGRRREPGD